MPQQYELPSYISVFKRMSNATRYYQTQTERVSKIVHDFIRDNERTGAPSSGR